MIKNKCMGCLERHIGCHQSCDSYQLFNKECIRIREAKKMDSIYRGYMSDCMFRADKQIRAKGCL